MRHIEWIDAECSPKGKLPDAMLFGMAGGAERNCIAIARLHPYTTIGSGAHMRPPTVRLCRRRRKGVGGQKRGAAAVCANEVWVSGALWCGGCGVRPSI